MEDLNHLSVKGKEVCVVLFCFALFLGLGLGFLVCSFVFCLALMFVCLFVCFNVCLFVRLFLNQMSLGDRV